MIGGYIGKAIGAAMRMAQRIPGIVSKGYPTLHVTRKRRKRKSLEDERAEIRQVLEDILDPKPPAVDVPQVAIPEVMQPAIDMVGPYKERLAALAAELRAKEEEEALILLFAA